MTLSEAARGFVGVRFKHRGRDRLGLDCAGLVWASYAACGVVLPDYVLYGRTPHRDGLTGHVSAALGEPIPTRALAVDDVLVMRFKVEPHHMAIVGLKAYAGSMELTLIHADGDTGRVHEQRLIPEMIERVTHVYRRPV